jgi:hypothetical protein
MRDDRSPVQTLALVLGVVYLLVGILGFIPPLLRGALPGVMGPFKGNLLGIFAVNWFHSIAHLLIGAAGLASYRSFSASRSYALAVGITYAALFVLGILGITLGGLLPLNGPDNVLHALTALVLLAVYFTAGARRTVAA